MTDKKPMSDQIELAAARAAVRNVIVPKPLEPLLPGETRSEYLDRLERAQAGKTQQLVARLKKSSKYYGQTAPGAWFDVRVVNDSLSRLRGNNNNYRLSDVALGMRIDGGVINLSNGKVEG